MEAFVKGITVKKVAYDDFAKRYEEAKRMIMGQKSEFSPEELGDITATPVPSKKIYDRNPEMYSKLLFRAEALRKRLQ